MGLRDRLQMYINSKGMSTQAFEKAAGLSNAAVSKMGDNTRTATLDKISNCFPDLNIDWLRTGVGEMLKEDSQLIVEGNSGCQTRNDMTIQPPLYSTYLLPISSRGGTLTGFAAPGTSLEHCEKIVSPIADVDFAISVYGESMSPEYPSGSTVLIKKVDPTLFIEWGKVFVLDTPNGVILKEVHQSSREGYVTCHSINQDPKYADFDVPLREVYGMYRVLMCLSVK